MKMRSLLAVAALLCFTVGIVAQVSGVGSASGGSTASTPGPVCQPSMASSGSAAAPAGAPVPVGGPGPGFTPRGGIGGGTTGVPIGGGTTAPVRKKAAGGTGRYYTPWGHQLRSPRVCRILDLRWLESDWPTATTEKGYAKSLAPLSHILTKKCFDPYCTDLHCKHFHCKDPKCSAGRQPALVYIYDPAETRAAKMKRERELFGDDEIVAATNFLHLFSIAATGEEKAMYLNGVGKTLPALVFLAPDGHTIRVLEGRLTRARLASALDEVFKVSLGWKRDRLVRHYDRLLKQIETYEDRIAILATRANALDAKVRSKPRDHRRKAQWVAVQNEIRDIEKKLQKVESRRLRLLRPDLMKDVVAKKKS
ncbi:MAG TPA: hypothetical protein ENK43_12580 [Planctomycetes bacterium]|nr:hypothetical protein [Planctomycetota bacterium]